MIWIRVGISVTVGSVPVKEGAVGVAVTARVEVVGISVAVTSVPVTKEAVGVWVTGVKVKEEAVGVSVAGMTVNGEVVDDSMTGVTVNKEAVGVSVARTVGMVDGVDVEIVVGVARGPRTMRAARDVSEEARINTAGSAVSISSMKATYLTAPLHTPLNLCETSFHESGLPFPRVP